MRVLRNDEYPVLYRIVLFRRGWLRLWLTRSSLWCRLMAGAWAAAEGLCPAICLAAEAPSSMRIGSRSRCTCSQLRFGDCRLLRAECDSDRNCLFCRMHTQHRHPNILYVPTMYESRATPHRVTGVANGLRKCLVFENNLYVESARKRRRPALVCTVNAYALFVSSYFCCQSKMQEHFACSGQVACMLSACTGLQNTENRGKEVEGATKRQMIRAACTVRTAAGQFEKLAVRTENSPFVAVRTTWTF